MENIFKPITDTYNKYINNEEVKDSIKIYDVADLTNRSIIIQDIFEDTGTEINNFIRFWNLKDYGLETKKKEPIKIYINSPGGDLVQALSIVDSIRLSKTPIWTINIGKAYSAGLLIFIAGHKRIAYPNSSFLFHEGSIYTGGDAHKFQNQADFYKLQRKRTKNFILSNTKITEEIYNKYEKDDWWLFSEDALNYGIVDEVAETFI